MNKVWIILFVVLFILIVFALHLTFKKRQESIDALNNKIDELLKNQEEYLNFKGKFNDLYKNEVFEDSKS